MLDFLQLMPMIGRKMKWTTPDQPQDRDDHEGVLVNNDTTEADCNSAERMIIFARLFAPATRDGIMI